MSVSKDWMYCKCACGRVIQGAFPGNLQLVLVLRPSRFFQRAISDIGFKMHKDDFKMKVPVSMLQYQQLRLYQLLSLENNYFSLC